MEYLDRSIPLALMAKVGFDIDNLKDPVESEVEIPISEGAQDSETETQRKARETRNIEVMKVYDNAEDKRIAEEKRKIGGMRRIEADKKLRFILYLALGYKGKSVVSQ